MHAQGALPSAGTAQEDQWELRAFEKQLINVLPDLRAIARILTRNGTAADDLVQDTVVRALRAARQFDPHTSMKAWTFRILHNCHINSFRRRRPMANIEDIGEGLPILPNQEDSLNLKDVFRALDTLVPSHREVIMLIRASGVSYDDAATIMSCKIGTIKSRLNRADAALRAALGPEYAVENETGVPTDSPSAPGNLGQPELCR
jgi:RNA polymerase sigma-70 factor (ECF subfamily)